MRVIVVGSHSAFEMAKHLASTLKEEVTVEHQEKSLDWSRVLAVACFGPLPAPKPDYYKRKTKPWPKIRTKPTDNRK